MCIADGVPKVPTSLWLGGRPQRARVRTNFGAVARPDDGASPSLTLNLIGSAILAVLAAHEHQWGFLLLEASWAAVSAWSLIGVTGGGQRT